jgi:hypothetical protein
MHRRKFLFVLELAFAGGSLALALVTLARKDWIEIIFGIDPDKYSGSLEWLIVAAGLVLALICGVAAVAEWRRLHPAKTGS